MFKFGYITIIGVPNVGKSTLLNKVIGQNIAIATNKVQTTRNKILGFKTTDTAQMVFVDTPGMHNAKSTMNKLMLQQIDEGLNTADVIYFMISPDEKSISTLSKTIPKLQKYDKPVFFIINKSDIFKAQKTAHLVPEIAEMYPNYASIINISAKNGTNIDKLLQLTEDILPEGRKYFDEEQVTDQSEAFFISEHIREQIFILTNQEVPYSVVVESTITKDTAKEMHVNVDIICDRKSQKGIIIGKNGETIKTIGTNARAKLETFFNVHMVLTLYVKNIEDWHNKNEYLRIQKLI